MKDRVITIGDRFASAAVLAVASFLTGLFLWILGQLVLIGGMFDPVIPFFYVWYFMAFFVSLAFILPTLAMNLIEKLWKDLAKVFDNDNNSA